MLAPGSCRVQGYRCGDVGDRFFACLFVHVYYYYLRTAVSLRFLISCNGGEFLGFWGHRTSSEGDELSRNADTMIFCRCPQNRVGGTGISGMKSTNVCLGDRALAD